MFNTVLYLEVNIFAIFILFILYNGRLREYLSPDQKLYNMEIWSIIIVLAFNSVTWVLNGRSFSFARELNIIAEYLYWAASLFPCCIGALYCLTKVYGRLSKKMVCISFVPVIAGLILLIINIPSDIIFVVSKYNLYSRGKFYFLIGFFSFINIIEASAVLLKRIAGIRHYERKRYVVLLVYMIFPVAGALLQMIFYGMNTIWISLTISAVWSYLYIQNSDASEDALTRLNNRQRFEHYTQWKCDKLNGDISIYIIIVSINGLRHINDMYGHTGGDNVLIRTAGVIKNATRDCPAFLARVSGDEFAIILNNVTEERTRDTIGHIQKILENENKNSEQKISLSTGYAGMTGNTKTDFDKLYSKADEMMHSCKTM